MRSFVLAIVLLATAALVRAQDAASTPFQARTPAVSEETPTPTAKTKAHAGHDRETVSERDDQTARQRHTGADRDRNAFARADRNRDSYPGPFAARESFADHRCLPNPNAARGSNRHYGSDGAAAGDFHRQAAN